MNAWGIWFCNFRYAIVEELAGFGARVHTCARDQTLLDECLSEWKEKGFQVTGSVCDASSWTEREKLMQTVSTLFDAKLSILVSYTHPSNIIWLFFVLCKQKTDQESILLNHDLILKFQIMSLSFYHIYKTIPLFIFRILN